MRRVGKCLSMHAHLTSERGLSVCVCDHLRVLDKFESMAVCQILDDALDASLRLLDV